MAEPVNAAMLDHAAREVRAVFSAAERGEAWAERALLRFAAAEALETALTRVAGFADKCAPTLDELKLSPGQYSYDAQQLRFAADDAAKALSQAAGRAVVVELPAREAQPDPGAAA